MGYPNFNLNPAHLESGGFTGENQKEKKKIACKRRGIWYTIIFVLHDPAESDGSTSRYCSLAQQYGRIAFPFSTVPCAAVDARRTNRLAELCWQLMVGDLGLCTHCKVVKRDGLARN